MTPKKLYRLPLYLLIFFITFSSCKESNENTAAKPKPVDKAAIERHGGVSSEANSPIYFNLELSPIDYINWVKDNSNDLKKSKIIQDIHYTVNYLPLDYMLCNELRKKNISNKEKEALIKEYEGMEYYELKIQALDHNDELAKYQLFSQQQYQERIQYMAFDMQKDIKLINDQGQQKDCKLYHFERTYGITPHSTFLIGFSKEDIGITNERTIVINDQLFNKGLIKFNWTEQTLNNVPKLSVI